MQNTWTSASLTSRRHAFILAWVSTVLRLFLQHDQFHNTKFFWASTLLLKDFLLSRNPNDYTWYNKLSTAIIHTNSNDLLHLYHPDFVWHFVSLLLPNICDLENPNFVKLEMFDKRFGYDIDKSILFLGISRIQNHSTHTRINLYATDETTDKNVYLMLYILLFSNNRYTSLTTSSSQPKLHFCRYSHSTPNINFPLFAGRRRVTESSFVLSVSSVHFLRSALFQSEEFKQKTTIRIDDCQFLRIINMPKSEYYGMTWK